MKLDEKNYFLSGLLRNDLSIFKNIRKQTMLSVEFRPDPEMRRSNNLNIYFEYYIIIGSRHTKTDFSMV